jgi:hypothetical protein
MAVREMCTESRSKLFNVSDNLKDQKAVGKIILKYITAISLKSVHWIKLALYRIKWYAFVNTAMKFRAVSRQII